jgi:hypothetical protein
MHVMHMSVYMHILCSAREGMYIYTDMYIFKPVYVHTLVSEGSVFSPILQFTHIYIHRYT